MKHFKVRAVATCLGLASAVSTALAGDSDAFMTCGSIEENLARLACYDRVYESRLQKLDSEETTEGSETDSGMVNVEPVLVPEEATDSAAVEQARAEAAFGFPQPTYPEDIETLRSKVIKYGQNSRKQVLFYLENGQVWIQAESKRFVTPGELRIAEISPGMFGAFFLTLEGKRQRVKVKRIR